MPPAKICILSADDSRLQAQITGLDSSQINLLRKLIMRSIPTAAPEIILPIKNTVPMPDEVISMRIAMVPFISDAVDIFPFPDECNCQDFRCPECSIEFRLKAGCKKMECNVTGSWLRWIQGGPVDDKGKPLIVPDPNALILKLDRGEEIDFQVFVQKGLASTHAKWISAARVTFDAIPRVMVRRTEVPDVNKRNALITDCKKAILFRSELNRRWLVREEEFLPEFGCDTSRAIVDYNFRKDFLFTVEATPRLPAQTIFDQGLELLQTEIPDLEIQYVDSCRRD